MVALQPMQSSNIKAAGYDPARQELFIEFMTGPTYRYDKVPEILWKGLLAAESHGKFLRESVQLKGFPYQRVI
jgi:hypothetical protein